MSLNKLSLLGTGKTVTFFYSVDPGFVNSAWLNLGLCVAGVAGEGEEASPHEEGQGGAGGGGVRP